jgi:hypothetical protein
LERPQAEPVIIGRPGSPLIDSSNHSTWPKERNERKEGAIRWPDGRFPHRKELGRLRRQFQKQQGRICQKERAEQGLKSQQVTYLMLKEKKIGRKVG